MSLIKRREGLAKLTGREPYVDDDAYAGAPAGPWLWGATVRSPAARGRIRAIRFDDAIEWDTVTRVDHRDLPGPNVVALIEDDQPILAAHEVRHRHEPVLLLAHPSRAYLRRAVAGVEIEVDKAPPALDFRVPPPPEAVQHGPDNVFKRLTIEKGAPDASFETVFDTAPQVIEGVYQTGAQEHVYLETQAMSAWIEPGDVTQDGSNVVVVRGSMQCPYYVHKALTQALDRPGDRVRVIQSPTGGGFGGKEDFPSGLAIHAALLTLRAQKPVKLVYERGEDMAATTKRHPSWIRHRTAVDTRGKLLAQDIEIVLDAGAYQTLSTVVLSRALIHAAGPYACDHVRIRGRTVLTNAVPFGAFRGFGAPQSLFACERHMDRIADLLGLDPVTIRRRNLLDDGQTTATGQRIDDGTDRQALLDHALERADWHGKRTAHAAFNRTDTWRRRGIGLATFFHGAGFTGSGEVRLDSVVHVDAHPDGRVEVLTAATEMGQGTITIFTQLAADALGLDPTRVVIAEPDTARVPDSGPTVGSRTAMIVGRLVERACDDLRRQLGVSDPPRQGAVARALDDWFRQNTDRATIRGTARYDAPPGIVWNDDTYRGDAYGAYGWATYVADVEVDLRTYTARVIDFVAVQEIGKVLHETLARGQIQGGVVQGIGWVFLEDVVWEDGGMKNHQLTNYIIPTSEDVPSIRVSLLENPYPHGARGAKGIGELPMDGPGPAIANAVIHALGVDPTVLPLVPERIMALVDDRALVEREENDG